MGTIIILQVQHLNILLHLLAQVITLYNLFQRLEY
jgi:hypothetical protein